MTVTPFITSAKEALFSSLFVSRITQKLLNRFLNTKFDGTLHMGHGRNEGQDYG